MEEEKRQLAHRRTVDHGNAFTRWMIDRTNQVSSTPLRMRPDAGYIINVVPPHATRDTFASQADLPTKFVHTSINKIKHPVLAIAWTPDGRRILTGSVSGEFTLWNGMSFNFETIMQAHDHAIRALCYSHNKEWLLSSDHEGVVKFWQPNFNNVNILSAHRDAIRDVAFSPNDSKFVTASDDGTLKVWNFADASEETELKGHGWDVKCCDWHPTLGLIASGSKDNLVKLWDPRASSAESGRQCVATLHGYKNTVTKTKFQTTGTQRLLASTSKDTRGKILDLRAMKDICVMRHETEATALAWHSVHPNVVSTGTHKGAISHFLLDTQLPENTTALMPNLTIPHAHDWPIWALEYHQLGHILASGSNDKMTRFWCRSRPNDEFAFKDRFYSEEEAIAYQNANLFGRRYNNNNNNNTSPSNHYDAAPAVSAPLPPPPPPTTLPGLGGSSSNNNYAIPGFSRA